MSRFTRLSWLCVCLTLSCVQDPEAIGGEGAAATSPPADAAPVQSAGSRGGASAGNPAPRPGASSRAVFAPPLRALPEAASVSVLRDLRERLAPFVEREEAPWLGFAMGQRELVVFDALSGARRAAFPMAASVLQLEWLKARCTLALRVSDHGADERVLGLTLRREAGALELHLEHASEPRRGPAWLVRAGEDALWLAHDAERGWQALDAALEPTGEALPWPAPGGAAWLSGGLVGVKLHRGERAALGYADLSLAQPTLEQLAVPHLVSVAAFEGALWLWREPPQAEPVIEQRSAADRSLIAEHVLVGAGALRSLVAVPDGVVAEVWRGGVSHLMELRLEGGELERSERELTHRAEAPHAAQRLAASGALAWLSTPGEAHPQISQFHLPQLTRQPAFDGEGLTAPFLVPARGALSCLER